MGSSQGPVLLLGFLLATLCDPLAASCPIIPVPADRWGRLEPRAILGDRSCDTGGEEAGPYWYSVDVENGWVFAAAGNGITIHDARTSPAAPPPAGNDERGYVHAPDVAPIWLLSDQSFYVFDIDAPPGVDDLVVTATSGNGLVAWNTADKLGVSAHYQDAPTLEVTAVYATTIGARRYAFAAVQNGLTVYDLTAAQSLSSCLDDSPSGDTDCGVYLGRFAGGTGLVTSVAGAGDYLAANLGSHGAQVWDVSTPAAPVLVLEGGPPAAAVEMWVDDEGVLRLALATGADGLRIYDVDDARTAFCHASPCALPGADTHVDVGRPIGRLKLSYAGSIEVLWASSTSAQGPQDDWVLDVSDPFAPYDLTPQVHPEGYWGWYYADNPTGFSSVTAGVGALGGAHLYRVGFGVLDVHEWLDLSIGPGGLFADGFESGDPSRWSAVVGSP